MKLFLSFLIVAFFTTSCTQHIYYHNPYLSKAHLKRDFASVNSDLHLINKSFSDFAIIAARDNGYLKYILFCPWSSNISNSKDSEQIIDVSSPDNIASNNIDKTNLSINQAILSLNIVVNEDNFKQFKNILDVINASMSSKLNPKDGKFINSSFSINTQSGNNDNSIETMNEIYIVYEHTDQGYNLKMTISYWNGSFSTPLTYSLNQTELLQLKTDFLSAELYLRNLK